MLNLKETPSKEWRFAVIIYYPDKSVKMTRVENLSVNEVQENKNAGNKLEMKKLI